MPTLSDYRNRPHWSFSAISQFLNCGLQYAFDRIYKLQRQFTSSALPFGNTWHRVCEHIAWKLKDGVETTAGEAHDLFSELWDRQLEAEDDIRFKTGEDRESLRNAAKPMLAAYIAGINPGEKIISINECFAVPMYDASGLALEKPFVGEIDRVVEVCGKPIVVDDKTAGRKWSATQADNHMQATLYCHAYRLIKGEEAEFRFDIVTKTQKPVFQQCTTRRTPDSAVRLAEITKAAEVAIKAEAFFPNEQSYFCAGCGHAEACREWHNNASKLISTAA